MNKRTGEENEESVKRNRSEVISITTEKAATINKKEHRSLVWFRSDLRTKDNRALSQATSYAGTPDGVVSIYIVSKNEWKRHDWGAVKAEFIKRNLIELSKNLLENFNIPLIILEIDSFENVPQVLTDFALENGISAVWFNNEPEWDECERDSKVEIALNSKNILCRRFDEQCIVSPGLVLTKESKPYSVFTPFKNTWLAYIESNPIKLECEVIKQTSISINITSTSIEQVFNGLPEEFKFQNNKNDPEMSKKMIEMWPAGEAEAHARLDRFAKLGIRNYKESRDFPHLSTGTSSLSPYLALGIISARTCFLRAKEENHGKLLSGSEGICVWISELCWRDFYRHILFHFPRVARGKPFKIDTDQVEWKYPKLNEKVGEEFDRWCRGFTGFPIVDAAMRQLNSTGWMHNRLRMIVSSFLTKDLLIDWRAGEKYFMKKLIDGDFASNNGGWQWSASTGTDSQPYFRIFNPQSQSERFDPNGEFIRKWVPELKDLPLLVLHDPSKKLSAAKLKSIGYCEPMVDHAKARIRTIEAFKKVFSKK